MNDEMRDEERTPRVLNMKRVYAGDTLWIDADRYGVKIWGRTDEANLLLSIARARELRTALGLAIAASEGLAKEGEE